MKKQYNLNKQAPIGYSCICPSCGQPFIKQHYQQAFCLTKSGTKCKDKYWNTVDPKKRNNTTRISPKSKQWKNEIYHEEDTTYGSDFDNDPSWDAHKDSF